MIRVKNGLSSGDILFSLRIALLAARRHAGACHIMSVGLMAGSHALAASDTFVDIEQGGQFFSLFYGFGCGWQCRTDTG
jgi:hypothetical protein